MGVEIDHTFFHLFLTADVRALFNAHFNAFSKL
jgi:hypothetical protein